MVYVRVLIAILIIGVMAGCDGDDPVSTPDKEEFVKYEEFDVDPEGLQFLSVINVNGSIEISGNSGDSVRVRVKKICEAETVAEAQQYVDSIMVSMNISSADDSPYFAAVFDVQQPSGSVREYKAEFTISVPKGVYLEAIQTNGSIEIEGIEGNIGAILTNGDIDCVMDALEGEQVVELSVTNGNAVLKAPPTSACSFTVSTVNGLAEVSGFSGVNYTLNDEKLKTGSIGGGGATADVSTVNGMASLVQK